MPKGQKPRSRKRVQSTGVREQKHTGPRVPIDAIKKQHRMDVKHSHGGSKGTLYNLSAGTSQIERRVRTQHNSKSMGPTQVRRAPKRLPKVKK